jgi:hypothetical protein
VNGSKNRFQAYIYERMLDWAQGLPRHGHRKNGRMRSAADSSPNVR